MSLPVATVLQYEQEKNVMSWLAISLFNSIILLLHNVGGLPYEH